ncbi:MAG: class I SAM-dependent methyltransferase, partial [Rickettsiales bacterium]
MTTLAAQQSESHQPDPAELDYEGTYIPCNLCEAEAWEIVATKDRHGKPLHTALCRECGLVYTNPMPTAAAIEQYYSKDYRAQYKGVTQPKFKHIYRAGRMALERLERLKDVLKAGDTLVDVGSGGGEFVYLIHKLGLNVWGVEPNEGYAEYSRQEYDLPVQTGFWQTAEFTPGTVDVITAHHVVEHFDDPQAAIHTFAKWLKPGGYLIIDVPN